jgi:hypothetical protein
MRIAVCRGYRSVSTASFQAEARCSALQTADATHPLPPAVASQARRAEALRSVRPEGRTLHAPHRIATEATLRCIVVHSQTPPKRRCRELEGVGPRHHRSDAPVRRLAAGSPPQLIAACRQAVVGLPTCSTTYLRRLKDESSTASRTEVWLAAHLHRSADRVRRGPSVN